jgi:serine/threonine-protein kinase
MNAGDGYQLWSDRFDRELDDIFAIQDEIAHNIVDRLELTLGLKEAAPLVVRPTDDLEAYQLYLRGREAVQQRSPVSMRRGIDFFTQALGRDPAYARAHAGLAEAYIGLGVYGYMPPAEARRLAEASLGEATRLDPEQPAADALRAQLKLYLTPDWVTAGDDLAKALARNPNDATANMYAAMWNGLRGNRSERTASVERALAADPLSAYLHALAGHAFFFTGDYEEALAVEEKALALDPNTIPALWGSAMSLRCLGRFDEALMRMTRALEVTQRSLAVQCIMGCCLAAAGRREEARAFLTDFEQQSKAYYLHAGGSLIAQIGLGDEDRIAEALQGNIDAETGPVSLACTIKPELDALLTHPRLGPLVRRLPLYAQASSK